MAMAMRASVTVSMAAVIMGVFKVIFEVSFVVRTISLGITSDLAGINSTSSKVRPSFANLSAFISIKSSPFTQII